MLGQELSYLRMLNHRPVSEQPKGRLFCYTTGMSQQARKISSFIAGEWWWLSYLLVFSLAFMVFLVLQATPYFADPDSFYHAKMALLIRDQGLVKDFPWLRLTVLGQSYTDQHMLYHILLIPFVTWFKPLVGLKLATVVFGSTLFTVIYWMFRQFKVRWPLVFILLLLLIRPFTFRVSLAKAPSTSLIFFFIGLTWIFQYKLKRIFFLAFAYVWYYGGFPLLGVAALIASSTSWLYNRFHGVKSHRYVQKVFSLLGRHIRRSRERHLNIEMLGVVALGILAGLVINPYFPQNLTFYWHQLVNIGIINFQHIIGVGAEWYPYAFGDLVANGAIASLLVLLALLGMMFKTKQQSKQTWALFMLTIFFFLLTMKSRRYVEYYIPTAVIFSAFAISDALRNISNHQMAKELRGVFHGTGRFLLGLLLAAYVLFGLGYIVGRDFRNEMADLQGGFRLDKFQSVGLWLSLNTPVGSRIVHSDWDEFPVLFYMDSHNSYVAGLDPTFLYKANPDTYWTWANITLGKFSGNLKDAVTKTLGAQYVFVASGHLVMDEEFSENPDFRVVYRDAEATVYQVVPAK